jgi:hypothetical protein
MTLRHLLLSSLIILLFSLGCARTVTDKDVILNIQFEVTFEGAIDTSKYNYLVLFSKVSSPNIELPDKYTGSTDQYFPTPGRNFEEAPLILLSQTINDLYDDYFDTWSDYILINSDETLLYSSGSTGFETTSDNLLYVEEQGFTVDNDYSNGDTKILFSFDIDFLSASAESIRYISFATTEITDDGGPVSGYFRDKIDQQFELTIKQNEEFTEQDDANDSNIPDGAEIKAWRVEVF